MKRREALALLAAGAVPLAGCSSGDGDGDGDGGEDESDDGTEPVENTTDDVDGNSSDVNAGDGSDGNESDSDGQDDDGSDEPSGEELAQEAVAAAQTALSEAVSELESQGTAYGSLSSTGEGPPVVASLDSLSDGSVRDQLASVQTEVDAAREHDLTSEQEDVLGSIETAKDWLHAVLDAYPSLNDLYLEAHYAIQDFRAGGSDPDLQAVRRAVDQAEPTVNEVTDPYNAPDDFGSIDAISRAGFEAQRDRISKDFDATVAISGVIKSIRAGGEIFWPAREAYPGHEEGEDPEIGVFEDAQMEYQAAIDGLPGSSGSMSAAMNYCSCYASNLETAAEEYKYANDENKFGSGASEYSEAAEAAVEDARSCGFDWPA